MRRAWRSRGGHELAAVTKLAIRARSGHEVGSASSRRSRSGQRQLAADVEQDVGLAARHGLRIRRAHRLVVEVEPLLRVDRERRVVARARATGITKGILW